MAKEMTDKTVRKLPKASGSKRLGRTYKTPRISTYTSSRVLKEFGRVALKVQTVPSRPESS